MKLLTATRERQGEQDGDRFFATEGELVLLGFVCATDEADPDGGCGCGRAFSGMSSLKATTTALVSALSLPVGAVVGRRLNHLTWRSEPSEVGEH